MGCLRFTAHTGERYYAECTMAGGKTERFDLPASTESRPACLTSAADRTETFTVLAQSPDASAAEGAETAGRTAAEIICYHRPGGSYDLRVADLHAASELPGGVLQILLLDKAGNALSERLVFNQGRRTCDDRRAGAEARSKQRTKVTLAVTATDPDGGPAAGDFSIAVTDRAAVPCGDVGQHLFDAAAELRAAGYDRDARLVLRGAGRRTGRGARRAAAHAGMAALRRAGRGTGRVCDAGLPARSRAGDRGADQQGRTVEQEEEARPLRDADDRAAVALLVAGADRQGGTVLRSTASTSPTARSTCCVPQQRKGCCRRQR